MFGTYIGNNKMLVKLAYEGMLMVSADDLSLMPSLVTNGYIEYPLTNYFINEVKSGDTVVDIGTNVGYFTLLAGKLVGNQGKVIGFEANTNVFSLLEDNIAMNWLTEQIAVYNKAVYSENTTLKLKISNKFQGDSTLKKNSLLNDADNILLNVEAISLDSELNHLKQIDVLKIDIEGGEYHAFLGMMDMIKLKKIKRIVFEWNKKMLGDEVEPFAELLKEILYSYDGLLYTLNNKGEPLPTTIETLTSIDFYPFALIEII
ncbi:FkbM family methyltransferase [Bacillus tianshenii]|uniref:FkbM family methyltransferase n=1 Tax=Sutcliffiella tianshenii TaxID=1463404 RepID=UPI001CD4522D|nr:FkbM family methyltransferase [Bacillus tianshenii]MCA1320521.1 FkbM family methyltransferase [Bacillus tianshenii]